MCHISQMATESKRDDAARPRGSVLLGGVFDFSGSMKAAITGGADEAQRVDSVFETLETLNDVAREEALRHGRHISVFSSAVGIKAAELRSCPDGVCDLLQLVDNAEDLALSRLEASTLQDLIDFAKTFPDGARAEYWIWRHVEPGEAGPLVAYLATHRHDAPDGTPSAPVACWTKSHPRVQRLRQSMPHLVAFFPHWRLQLSAALWGLLLLHYVEVRAALWPKTPYSTPALTTPPCA